jgi:hypothetical protein
LTSWRILLCDVAHKDSVWVVTWQWDRTHRVLGKESSCSYCLKTVKKRNFLDTTTAGYGMVLSHTQM